MQKLLIQFDTDPLPSVFDRVVAVDAGVDQLFSYGGITPENVTGLVHGCIFTRKLSELKSTAIFIGGSQVSAGEALVAAVTKAFYGPMRVSVMMDSNGSNTTAAAAVLAAGRHLDLTQVTATVLAGTGPVGWRAVQLLQMQGATVRLGSRTLAKAQQVISALSSQGFGDRVTPVVVEKPGDVRAACEGAQLVIAAGAAGVELLPQQVLQELTALKVAIDVNAVPPVGIAGVEATDKGRERNGILCYGALGVGGLKMKIHTACIQKLFEANDVMLDTVAIYNIGKPLA